jgi:hypothetical protein
MVCVSLSFFEEDRGRLPSVEEGSGLLVSERFLEPGMLEDSRRRPVRHAIADGRAVLRLSGGDAPEISVDCVSPDRTLRR